jgi:GMP synthase-like glutamine amidotransferase
MRIHYLQHVPFENPAYLMKVFADRGHTLTHTELFAGDSLPSPDSFDWLVVMGGPMGIFDEDKYPWIAPEKHFIKAAIDADKMVLGICLGAQFIAHVLGARVFANTHREIGWFDITPSTEIRNTPLARVFAEPMPAFHWHGDTFEIPEGAIPIGSTAACKNQGFVFEDNVLALQFHLETTEESASALIENCGSDLEPSSGYVQSAAEMLSAPERFARLNQSAQRLIEVLGG